MNGGRSPAVGGGWDAIVVGAGQGGLTCAAYLAVGGLKVLVLEQYKIAGGCTQVFRRRGTYEFDVGTHYLGDAGPGGLVSSVYEGLGLGDRIEFRELNPDGFDRVVLPTVTVDVPKGWPQYRERMAAALPAEAAAVRAYVDTCAAIHASLRAMVVGLPDAPADPDEPFARWRTASLHDLMSHCGLSDRAVTVLGAQAANYGLGPMQVSVVTHVAMLGEFLLGAYYPVGGGQMLAAGLVEVITAYGGELRTRTRVERIEVEHGRVTGVRLADGEVLYAPIVVSNADYRRTVLDLVGPDHLPAAVVSRARRLSMALPLVSVYLAVSRDAAPPPAFNLWCFETESIIDAFAEIESGDFTEPRFAFISSGSAKGGPAAPPGRTPHHTIEVLAVAPAAHRPWLVDEDSAMRHDYRNDAAYLAEKDRIGQSLVDMAERYLGPLRPHLLHYEVATPATQTRFTLASGGTPYGVASTPRQLALYRPGHRGPLPGLYLAGVNTRSGLGISGAMIGGVRCAELILQRSMLTEVHLGKVLGNAELLPPRPPGWDPLLASRGSRSTVHDGRKA